MLYRTVISPSVFNITESNSSQYRFVISLLKDLDKNGLILVDKNDRNEVLFPQILQYVENWDTRFKIPAKKLIKKLRENNRIIKISDFSQVHNTPITCGYIVDQIALKFSPDAIFSTQNCCINNKINQIDIMDYVISGFDDKIQSYDFSLNQGQWTKEIFENEVLISLFKDAKYIKLYNRYIGRTILTKNRGYRNTLNWILDVFIRESNFLKPGVSNRVIFEIYTGIQVGGKQGLSTSDLYSAITAIRELEKQLYRKLTLQKSNADVKIYIKKENDCDNPKTFPHARYLFTDQIGLCIDRGFDLLYSPDQNSIPSLIKDLHISYHSDKSKIAREVNQLEDLL
ncbi:hypothetical protein [Planktothrix mougeotii]|uniref:Uncharacterized protein n=1 Tax=Planktothrix mougeotii LEGE 06226 TaxID=1828728 RepID=A0ABR9U9M7_9CYAN|nr:hypothetical protein [Planktothrix mougeotii]MBE9142334.1 hypothetical protein [Planktothrix mougeotii LEGE 06226]